MPAGRRPPDSPFGSTPRRFFLSTERHIPKSAEDLTIPPPSAANKGRVAGVAFSFPLERLSRLFDPSFSWMCSFQVRGQIHEPDVPPTRPPPLLMGIVPSPPRAGGGSEFFWWGRFLSPEVVGEKCHSFPLPTFVDVTDSWCYSSLFDRHVRSPVFLVETRRPSQRTFPTTGVFTDPPFSCDQGCSRGACFLSLPPTDPQGRA